jgi:RNA polymerase sigma-70 factor (ECF subfamily)
VSTDAREAVTLVEGGAMAEREPTPKRTPHDGVPPGDGAEQLAREFLQHRPRLLGVAYRLLGTMWDAEDIVADAMVRWLNVEQEQIRDPAAFLITMVTRRALDQLRSARVARERYTGEWLPEPIGTEPSPVDPLDTVERRESVSLAALRMMERLTPPERAVFVLHEAFAVPHAEIADVLDITPTHSRQHLHRARSHLEGADPPFDVEDRTHDTLFERFLAALEDGDLDRVRNVLADDVVAYSDGGGKARAARRPVTGVEEVVGYFGALRRHHSIRVERRVEVNGEAAALLWFGRQYQLLAVDVRAGHVSEIYSIMNPDKLEYLSRQLAAQ